MALPAVLSGQVPVDISSQKIISGGKVYYMHPVLKGQTLYSISRAYKVTIDDITRINVIPPNGIQTEQVLKIPASEAMTASQSKPQPQPQAKPQPPAQPQSQPKPQPPSQPQSQPKPQPPSQPQSQPKAQSQSAPATTQAKTAEQPATQSQTQSQTQPKTQPEAQPAATTAEKKPAKAAKPESHKVQRGESLSSIARDHGVTERELKKANKGLLFPMPGMYLVIPAKQDEQDDSVNKEK